MFEIISLAQFTIPFVFFFFSPVGTRFKGTLTLSTLEKTLQTTVKYSTTSLVCKLNATNLRLRRNINEIWTRSVYHWHWREATVRHSLCNLKNISSSVRIPFILSHPCSFIMVYQYHVVVVRLFNGINILRFPSNWRSFYCCKRVDSEHHDVGPLRPTRYILNSRHIQDHVLKITIP